MKKTILTTVFVVFAFFVAQAQIGTGTLSVGGALELSTSGGKYKGGSNSVDKPSNSSFTFGPQVSYFLSDELSVGAALLYSSTTSNKTDNDNKNVSNAFYFTPFARYHVPVSEKFYLFGEARLGFGVESGKTVNGGTSTKDDPSSSVGFAVSPGLLFLPGERIGIELSVDLLSFNSRTQKDNDDSSYKNITNSFAFGPNLMSPSLSVQFYF